MTRVERSSTGNSKREDLGVEILQLIFPVTPARSTEEASWSQQRFPSAERMAQCYDCTHNIEREGHSACSGAFGLTWRVGSLVDDTSPAVASRRLGRRLTCELSLPT